jgi:hypothetical protein
MYRGDRGMVETREDARAPSEVRDPLGCRGRQVVDFHHSVEPQIAGDESPHIPERVELAQHLISGELVHDQAGHLPASARNEATAAAIPGSDSVQNPSVRRASAQAR